MATAPSPEPAHTPDPPPSPRSCELLSAGDLVPSPDHIRSSVDPVEQSDFEASIARDGILQPITVRPRNGKWEVVAGHRRLAAAKKAGMSQIPATVLDLDDSSALRVQIVENSQRTGVHPLDEARGYELLAKRNGMGVEAIAHEVSRPVSHVYDRIKLLQLIPDARRLFTEGKFTLGHAVVLARLSPADQAKALNLRDPERGGLFDPERTLFDPDETGSERGRWEYKPRSVAELQAWVDEHVRFGPKVADPMLFPETAEALTKSPKVVPITYSNYVHPDARDGKTYFPRSWKRADGEQHSKKCDHTILGYVAAGVHRGESFQVCIAKERCEVHWGAEMKARKRAAADRERERPKVGTNAAAKDRAPQVDPPELVRMLDAAELEAEKEIVRRLDVKAGSMGLEDNVRQLLLVWGLGQFAQQLIGKPRASEAAMASWIHSASARDLGRAAALVTLEYRLVRAEQAETICGVPVAGSSRWALAPTYLSVCRTCAERYTQMGIL
jgi:ParB family chromosome partitioning protein